MHEPLHLHITRNQLQKIHRGHPIQIKHEHIGHPKGHAFRNLHPMTHKKIIHAYHTRKGARVHITPAELEGTGLLDVIKKVGKFVGEHANVLKPLATTVLDTGAHFFPGAAPAREAVHKLTGVGVRKTTTRRRLSTPKMTGSGIIPAGYGGF